MSGRLNTMKYTAIVAVAVLSFILAIPLSRQPAKQPIFASAKPIPTKVVLKKVVKTQPTITHQTAKASVPQPTVVLASYKCEAYASLFKQYDWNTDTAMAICQAESSGIANQVSDPSINFDHIPDYGLMQLHGIDILDPAQNISYAYYHKYLTQGWGAWSTYNNGAYYKYL